MKWQGAIVTCCRLTEKSLIEKILSLIRFFKKRPGLDSSFDQRIKRLKKEAWYLTQPISEQEFN